MTNISPLTTKGDVITFAAANTRLAIGADGTCLTADSTTSTGNKWDDVAANANTQIASRAFDQRAELTNSLLLYSPIVPPGSIIGFGGSAAPIGWLLCDGTSYLRATYGTLYGVIGSNYGSVDGTHFNVPDLRANVAVGYKSGDANFGTLGGTAGAASVTLTIANLAAHIHDRGDSTTNNTVGGAATRLNAAAVGATSSTGSGTAHANIQPSLTINYIIKT